MLEYVFMTTMAAGGLSALGWGFKTRRDRPTGNTLWWFTGGIYALLLPATAITDSTSVALAMILILVVGLPGVALVTEWLRHRERLAHRDLAIAAGMTPKDARRQYRRAPRSFLTIIVIYGGLAMLWIFFAFAVIYALDNPNLVQSPSWRVTSGKGEPLDLPWWMASMTAVIAAGTVHAMVNQMRKS